MTEVKVEVGDLLDGRYEVRQRLKPGTMAAVFRVFDRWLDEEAFCKIPLDLSAYKVEALVDQYKRLKRLNSRHLPMLLGFGRHRTSEPHVPFIVTEWIVGKELTTWCEERPLRERLHVFADLAKTLSELGTRHGDLSPRNVLVAPEGRVVLVDPDAGGAGTTGGIPNTNPVKENVQGLVDLILEHTSENEQTEIGALRRLKEADLEGLSAADVATSLRHLLTLPLLPNESFGSLAGRASAHKRRTEDARGAFRLLCKQRDEAFLNVADLISRLAKELALSFYSNPQMTALPRPLTQELESAATGKGNLIHRLCTVDSVPGDRLWFVLDGRQDFRLPWPFPQFPGLLDRGDLNVLRNQKVVLQQQLEMWEREGTPVVVIRENDRELALDERAWDRTFDVLLEFLLPGLEKPIVNVAGRPTKTDWPGLDRKFLEPAFHALKLPSPETPLEWLRAATEVSLRLPRHSKIGNGVFGSGLHSFFEVPADYDSRLNLVKSAAAAYVESHGHFFATLYRFDVRVLDESSSRLRVVIQGVVDGLEPVDWQFDFSIGE